MSRVRIPSPAFLPLLKLPFEKGHVNYLTMILRPNVTRREGKMQRRELSFPNPNPPDTRELAEIIAAALAGNAKPAEPSLPASDFFAQANSWYIDCEARQLSPRLIELRKLLISKFRWWIEQRRPEGKTLAEHLSETLVNRDLLRLFLRYVAQGHQMPGGRWDNPRNRKEVKAATSVLYHAHLRTLCNWIVAEGYMTSSPMATLKTPINRPDKVKPFTPLQIDALLEQAKRTKYPIRDTAICFLLLDTGMRVTELCTIRRKDVDMESFQIEVEGKGDKKRVVAFGRFTRKALYQYIKERNPDDDDFLFVAEGGPTAGEPLTRSGVLQMIRRLGKVAGIEQARCSPHTFRHTFAIAFLRLGGNQFTLMAILGHTNVKQTNIYVEFARADVSAQHRMYSPVDRRKRKR